MKYDFTSLMNRSGHDSIAVDQIPIPGAEVKEGFSRVNTCVEVDLKWL